MTTKNIDWKLTCPIPISEFPYVTLAHGGGGKMSRELITKMFLPAFDNDLLAEFHDGAVFKQETARLAMTTDSYVVRPLFFPGGDIGSLAVYGTVNDLAMCGARARYLTTGFILEEGLAMETLWRIVMSMKQAAEQTGIKIVAGDTKVVDKGNGDEIFINTTGVGTVHHDLRITPASVCEGDCVIVSGDIARHGMAIMATREGLSFESRIESDTAPLMEPVLALLEAGLEIHCLRDLTRGGLASALGEIAASAGVRIKIDGQAIKVREDVRAACEILGLDPLYVANEGRFVVFVPEKDLEAALDILRKYPVCRDAGVVGTVSGGSEPRVTITTAIATTRVLDMISGEQLPRIC